MPVGELVLNTTGCIANNIVPIYSIVDASINLGSPHTDA